MFQFTTTNVINSNKDLTTGKPLWSAQNATDDKPASFNVKRVNNFIKDNVVSIYKAEARDPKFGKATIDLSTLDAKVGEQFRLAIYVGLTQASQNSLYSNDMIYKGKPFSLDFAWDIDDAAKMAAKIVKTINKYELAVYGHKLLRVSAAGAILTIEAIDEYQRFVKVDVEKFDAAAHMGMGEYKVAISAKEEDDAEYDGFNKIEQGVEGFGTYSFLLHNLRLPTTMRTRAYGINQDETPIVGAKYTQYTIHYCAKRGILGMNAVGDVTKSLTTHVFYVREDLAADFENGLYVIAPDEGGIEIVPAEKP